MNFDKIIALIGNTAPMVATALGSPVAGIAVKFLANLFDANAKDPDEILSKMSADPDYLLKVKQLEASHGEILSQLSVSEYKAAVDDTDNARAREIALDNLPHPDHTVRNLAYIFVAGFFVIILMQFFPFAVHNSQMMTIIVTALIMELKEIRHYFFGGSEWKQDK